MLSKLRSNLPGLSYVVPGFNRTVPGNPTGPYHESMAHSGKERHRDRDSRRRELEDEPPPTGRIFRITDAQRQDVAKCLRYIDEARHAIEKQQRSEERRVGKECRTERGA